ncbi:726_t:CDS:2 [Gigaspora rosea]|nr:726_t:CDS:2 [Gigaspora rosea]
MNKINVCGYLTVKEWVRENVYYWYCEKRKSNECKGRATKAFINNLYYFKKFNNHNYAPQASSAEVARSIASIRDRAYETNDQLPQIIQNTIINIPKEIYPYILSQNALRVRIKRVRRRKIQESKLSTCYGLDKNFSIKLRQLFALAFLPSREIPAAFKELKKNISTDAKDGSRTLINTSCSPPLFPLQMWSMHDSMETGILRTQNIVEAWYRRWENLVGRPHVGVYIIIEEFQKEQQKVEHQVEAVIHGAQHLASKKETIEREQRFNTIISNRENFILIEFLHGIAHNLSL